MLFIVTIKVTNKLNYVAQHRTPHYLIVNICHSVPAPPDNVDHLTTNLKELIKVKEISMTNETFAKKFHNNSYLVKFHNYVPRKFVDPF